MTKVYVAGKWSDKDIIRKYIDALKLLVQVTYDWTRSNEYKSGGSCEEKSMFAYLDAEGVKNADILIVILTDPHYEYRGTCTEMGIAIGLDKPVVLICPFEYADIQTNIFYWHKNVIHVSSFEECLKILDCVVF